MTTRECDEARNQPVPAPRKPVNFKVRSLSDRIAKQLTQHMNGSQEFAALISSTDVYCTIEEYAPETVAVFPPCAQLTQFNRSLSASLPKPLRRAALTDVQLLPLPPTWGKLKEIWSFGYVLLLLSWSLLLVFAIYMLPPRILRTMVGLSRRYSSDRYEILINRFKSQNS